MEEHIDASAPRFRRRKSLPFADSSKVSSFKSLRKFARETDKIILWYFGATIVRKKLGESHVAESACVKYVYVKID